MLGIYCFGVLMLISTTAAKANFVCLRTTEEKYPEHKLQCEYGEVLHVNSVMNGYEWMHCCTLYHEKFNALRCCNVSSDDCIVNANNDDIAYINNINVNNKDIRKDSNNDHFNNENNYYRIPLYLLTPKKNNMCQAKAGYQYSYQMLEYECVKSTAFSTSSRHNTHQITITTPLTTTITTPLTATAPFTTAATTRLMQNSSNSPTDQLSSNSTLINLNFEQSSQSKDKSGVIGGTVGGIIVAVIIVVVVVIVIKRKRQALSKPKGKVKNHTAIYSVASPVRDDIRIQGFSETNRQASETSYYEIADFHYYSTAGWVDETTSPDHQPTHTVPSIDIYNHLGEDKSKNKITPNTGLYNHIGETIEGSDLYNHIDEESSRKPNESKTKISQDSGLYHHISGVVEGTDLYNHIGEESSKKTNESKTKISQDSSLYHHISGVVEGSDLYNHIGEENIANSRVSLDLSDYDHISVRVDNSHDHNSEEDTFKS